MGTFGDLVPFLEIGTQLLKRGHRVVVASAEPFRAVAEKRGLDFVPTVSRVTHEAVLAKPELWIPQKSFSTMIEGFIEPHIRPLAAWVRNQPRELTLVTDFCGGPGARIAQELSGAGLVSIWPNPASLRSILAPPAIAGAAFLAEMPGPSQRVLAKKIYDDGDLQLGPPINAARAALGLAPIQSTFDWAISEQASVALFPEWFCARKPDWPTNLEYAGFVLSPNRADLPPSVEEFLSAGAPPVAVTFGTGMRHAQKEFDASLSACRNLGLRTLLIAPDSSGLSLELDDNSCLAGFVPFDTLLPRTQALIHHAGMGTCAQALAAGVPQLLIPLSHDQPDNAAGLVRLGVAAELPHRRLSVEALTEQLRALLTDEPRAASRSWAARVDMNGAERVCLCLEKAVAQRA